MQEEVDSRTVTLVISATKLTGRVLKSAMAKYVAHVKAKKAEKANTKPPASKRSKNLWGRIRVCPISKSATAISRALTA